MKRILENPNIYALFQWLSGVNRMRRILKRDILKPSDDMDILDVGCGPAGIISFLGESTYTGIDISQEYIQHAKKKNKLRKNTHFYCSELSEFLSNNQTKYDRILLLGIMHHLNDDELYQCLSSLKNALNPNGSLITLDGAFENSLNKYELFLLKNDRGAHIRTKDEWLRIFTSIYPNYNYTIRKDLYFMPYNIIIFHKDDIN